MEEKQVLRKYKPGGKRVQCPLCDRTFTDNKGLGPHMKHHRPKGPAASDRLADAMNELATAINNLQDPARWEHVFEGIRADRAKFSQGLKPQPIQEAEMLRTLRCVKQWLEIKNRRTLRETTAADVDHSALLRRLLAGKEPLPEPPPLKNGYPDYPD